MFPIPYLTLAKYIAVAAFLTSLFVWGHHRGYVSCETKWNAEKLAQQQAILAAQQAAQAKADSLTTQLQADRRRIVQLTKEKHDALLRLTDNRPCLYPDAISVINGDNKTHNNDHIATDADVANWALSAKENYVICSSKLNALIDFENSR